MKNIRTGTLDLFRRTLVLLLCLLPFAAYSAGTITVSSSVSPADTPVVDGWTIITQGSSYTVSFGFKVETSQTVSSVDATYTFGTRSGRLSASVSNGAVSISPLRFTNNLSLGDYEFNCKVTVTYTNGSSETLTGTSPMRVRVMTQASSSVDKLDYDAVLSGTNVILGPITLTGGYADGWNVAWSAGSPTGTNGTSCTFRPNSKEYQMNTITATVTNSMAGEELYREVYNFNVPSYGIPTATVTGAPAAVYAGTQLTLSVETSGGNPDGWSFAWNGSEANNTRDYTYEVRSVTGTNTGTMRVQVRNASPDSPTTYWYNDNIGASYTVYDKPEVTFTELQSSIITQPSTNFRMTATGGQSGRWSYEYYLDGTRVSTSSSYSYSKPWTTTTAEVHTLRAVAKNDAQNVAEPFEASREYKLIILPSGVSGGSNDTQYKAAFSGEKVPLSVNFSAGPEWKYQWTVNGEEDGSNSELEFVREVSVTTVFNVNCKVYANIDGQYIDLDYPFEVTVYPTPESSISYEPNYPSYIDGESFTATLNVSGGDPNAWTYKWYRHIQNGWSPDLAYTKSYKVNISYDADDYETDYGSYKNWYLRGEAANQPQNIDERFYKNWDKRYAVYPAATFEVGQDTYNLLSGNPFSIHVEAGGGAGWDYVWTEDGADMHVNESTINFTPVNDGTEVITKIYKVVASCWIPNGSGNRVVATREHTFTANIYPASSVRWASEYPEEIMSGTNVPMELVFADGNASNWNISWYVNNQLVTSAANSPAYTFDKNTPGEYNIRVELSNKQEPNLTFTMTHNLTVYSWPIISAVQESFNVISGTPVELQIHTEAGAPDWVYEWYEGDTRLSSDSKSVVVNSENYGSEVVIKNYHVDVINRLSDGTEITKETVNFTVNVYPADLARFAADYPAEIMSGTTVPMEVIFADGTASNWNILWYVNNQLVMSAAYSPVYTFDKNTPGEYNIRVELSNKQESNLSFTMSHNLTVYSWPIISAVQESFNVISGTPVELQIHTEAGAPDWVYEWYEGDTRLSSDSNSVVVNSENHGSEVVVKNYHADVINRLSDGTDITKETVNFTVNVYPADIARFAADYPEDMLVGDKVDMEVLVPDGDTSAWRFRWYLDYVYVSSASGNTYTLRPGAPGSYYVRVELQHRQQSDLSFNLSRSFNVYASPSLANPNDAELITYSGNTLHFTEDVIGGYPDGWTWDVSLNGVFSRNGTGNLSYTFVAPNVTQATVYEVVMNFVNKRADGSDINEFSITKHITVYPALDVKVTVTPDTKIIGVASSLEFRAEGSDVPGKWNYTWKLDNVQVSQSDVYIYQAPQSLTEHEEHEVVLEAVMDYDGKQETNIWSYQFEVWPDGAISSPLVQNVGTIVDRQTEIGVNVIGGLENWTFSWTKDGVAFDNNAPSFTETYTEAGRTHVYTVRAVFDNGVLSSDNTYTINVTVYEDASCEIVNPLIAVYTSYNPEESVRTSGGNPEGWKAEWNIFGYTIEGTEVVISVPDGTPAGTYTGSVYIYNTSPDGAKLYESEASFTIDIFSKGDASVQAPQYSDFAGVMSDPLTVVPVGGYDGRYEQFPGGWSYRWYREGEYDITTSDPVFTPPTENNGNERMTVTVNIEVRNTLNGVTGYHAGGSYTYELWPAAKVPEISLSATKVRQGENVALSIAPTGAYPETWEYEWYVDNMYISAAKSVSYTPESVPAQSTKDINTYDVTVQLRNYGPQNQTWYNNTVGPRTVSVYGIPMAPTQVVIKGNGTSHTVIAMMSQDDSQLEAQGYSYVFGYTDNTGDHALAPTANRYNHFPNMTDSQFSNQNFWVYTQWTFPDGSVVTSGKQYLNGYYDAGFDASVYAGGRGTAGIADIASAYIESDGYTFSAEPAMPCAARVTVYSAAGSVVRVLEYPQKESFFERVELGGLNAGMYIVDIQVGTLRTVKKVVVDNK